MIFGKDTPEGHLETRIDDYNIGHGFRSFRPQRVR
jgi:hypothetical protein